MPLYEYECGNGHRTDEVRRVSERDETRACPCEFRDNVRDFKGYAAPAAFAVKCGLPMRRVLSACASKFPGADSWRAKGAR